MLNMYNLGVHIRETYGDFLGDIYTSDTMKMRTAEYTLSMISGQLVNAGLWPPAEIQKWNTDMNWQPIPTDYEIEQKDTLLLGTQCPGFIIEMNKVLGMERVREQWSDHLDMFHHISQSTGMKIRQPSDVALLYAALETKADLNQSLPEWAQDIFPHGGMYNITLLEYDLLWQTTLQKQLNGGTMLKEVLANSLTYIDKTVPRERKLMIYSGNERNIVGVLKALNLWSPHIPKEAASVIFELYLDNETGDHGIKINYYTGVDDNVTIPLTIPNCTEICPIKTFLYLVMDIIPHNAEQLCNWQKIDLSDTILDNTIDNGSGSFAKSIATLIILWAITIFI